MKSRNKELMQRIINEPNKQKVLVFKDKRAMDSTRISLTQMKNRMASETGNRSLNVIVASETLPRPSSMGYTHRITLSYSEGIGDCLIYDIDENGEISPFQFDNTVAEDTVMNSTLSEKLDKQVARVIEVHSCSTYEEVMAHFQDSKLKPSRASIEHIIKAKKAVTKRKKDPAEIERQLKMMSEDGLTREQAKSTFPGASELLLDKYFPEEEPSSE